METEVLVVRDIDIDKDKLTKAAELIKNGFLVAIPTETVYGLGANALSPEAVKKIFEVKGRPQDNPLIIHISDTSELTKYCDSIPQSALLLASYFWPGPLTMILKRNRIIPDTVTAGLDTVAVRCPEHPIARELIRLSGVPIAAPSANISGSPSPTEAEHVIKDLCGKVPVILDGGSCSVGLESTIIDMSADIPRVLRPGCITPEQIEEIIGDIELDSAVLRALGENEKPRAPGMKYRHYAPRARVVIIKGDITAVSAYINNISGENTAVLCFDGEEDYFAGKKILTYGRENDYENTGKKSFHMPSDIRQRRNRHDLCPLSRQSGVGLAVANRLMKAAGYNILEVGK